MDHAKQIAQELGIQEKYVAGAIELIDQGNTIPFIARYRKEATNSMDDQVLRQLGERLEYLRNLDKRKEEVAGAIETLGAMTPEIQKALEEAATLAVVEDIYRPYKPKRKTRASVAKAKGLEPLAQLILAQDHNTDPEKEAQAFLTEEVKDVEEALAGARDIIAELVSDDPKARAQLRTYYQNQGTLCSKAAKEEDSVYSQYYEYTEPVRKAAGHRVLALDRGEREGFLKVWVEVDSSPPSRERWPWVWTPATGWAVRWQWWTPPARCWTLRWSIPSLSLRRWSRPSPSSRD